MKSADWVPYVPAGDSYVPVSRWGKDHWSTFAYLETCAVDKGGMIENCRMRCHARLHREFVAMNGDGALYPTRLKDGELERHDDWSCLEDMAAAGLIEAEFRTSHERPYIGCQARVRLTECGFAVAGQLREHKANGGTFHAFEPRVSEVLSDA